MKVVVAVVVVQAAPQTLNLAQGRLVLEAVLIPNQVVIRESIRLIDVHLQMLTI